MSNDPLQEAIAASFQDRVARKDGPPDQGPSGQPSTKEQEQDHADKNGEQATTAPAPRYNIDDCIRELSAAKPAQLPHICDPVGDTWIFIDPPAKQPEQTRVDYEEYRRKFEQPYRMDSARLSRASSFFRDRLAPSAQYRTLRRRRLVGQLPPEIKYVLDLTPPSEGDDAVYLTASLCCPEGVRFWYQAGDIWQISDALVGGHEEYYSREEGDFKKLIASPLEYSPIGHRSAIERVLAAIQGMSVRLDSAVKVWTMTVIAEHYRIAQSTCAFLTDSLLTWLRAEPNFYFLEINPEISLRMGKIIGNENLYRDAFAILVGEEALDSLVQERLPSSQKQTFSTCGRRKVDLPEELVQRIEYASKAFIERNISDFDRLTDSEMPWLEDLPTIQSLATFTDHDLVPIAASLKVIAKCYMRHILLYVLCNRGESFTGVRLPESTSNLTGALLLPQMKRIKSWNHLLFKERLFTRTFWTTVNEEMRKLRQNAEHMAPRRDVSGNGDIIARSLQEQYVASYSIEDHPFYRQDHLLEVAAKGQAILGRNASTSTHSETRLAQQCSDPLEIAGHIESEGPRKRLPFRIASQQPGENASSYDHRLLDGMLAPLPDQHQYETSVAYPNVEGEANPVCVAQSSMTGHDSRMPYRGPTRDQIAARMVKFSEDQERIDRQQDQAWMDWKAHMDEQGKDLMDDINASSTGRPFNDDLRSDTTTPNEERPFPWEWDGDMTDTDSPTLGQSAQDEPPEANSGVCSIGTSLPPPCNPFFDVKQFLREAASHISNVANQKLSSADAGPRGDPYHPGVINTLTSLEESEWKYCPLEFGGYDDGTGAVFSDDIMEAMPDAGFSTAGPSIHTGGSTYSSADSNEFDMLSDAGSSAGTINTSTAVADGYSDQLDRHRTYATSSVGGHSDDLEMDAAASDDEVRMARQQIQALEFTEAADAKAAAAAQAVADNGKQRADAIDSDYSDLFGDVDPAEDDDDDGDNAQDYDSDDTERGDGFERI